MTLLGMTEAEQMRFRTALTKVRGFTLAQLQSLDTISDRCVANTLKVIRQAEKHGIDTWIQEILDPKKGYSKAHTWARGTPKAPPLPTDMWRGGEYIGNSHLITQALLQDWGALWTQSQHVTAMELWSGIKTHARQLVSHLDPITMEDLERGLKMLNTNTAVGIDQWSSGQLRSLSMEAKELLLDILQDVERTKAWPGYAYYNIIVLMGKPA